MNFELKFNGKKRHIFIFCIGIINIILTFVIVTILTLSRGEDETALQEGTQGVFLGNNALMILLC